MERRLNILMLVKRFADNMPKHIHKFDMLQAIEKEANVTYWGQNGSILDILSELDERPDFIFHYDIEWHYAFAPSISELNKVDIPTGCYVLDVHYAPQIRRAYFDRNSKPDIIFSASKYPFLKVFPEAQSRFCWLPFGINPEMFKDYGLPKDIRYSLMGLMEGKYPFRQAVKERMKHEEGFVHFAHPGHRTSSRPGLFVHEKYATAINRSAISFTCGSELAIPVAKFFEIPACRTLMLAEPNTDIEELGYRDGVHYAACSQSNFYEQAKRYDADAAEREAISQNGHDFIHRHHTNEVRAKQFVAAVKQLLAGKAAQ